MLTLMDFVELFGRTEREFGVEHLQIRHFFIDGFVVVGRGHFLFIVDLFKDVSHISCHVYWSCDRV